MPSVLITGIAGFVGSNLAEAYLKTHEWAVHGTVRERSDLSNIEHIKDDVTLHTLDITDGPAVNRLLNGYERPTDYDAFDVVHHLAAVTFIPTSWDYPVAVMETNAIGTLNFLESLRSRRSDTVFHFCGTCEEYGIVSEEELPVKETNTLRPTSPYAVSKVAADLLCQNYARGFKVRAVISRAFNHTGLRRGKQFVTRTVCRQAAEIKKGRRKVFELGNADAIRDWTDVHDICDAYMKLANSGGAVAYGEPYNISSGTGRSIKDLVNHFAKNEKITNKIAIDNNKLRPIDNPVLIGDSSKFRKATGWAPKIDFWQTLDETYQMEFGTPDGVRNF